MISSIINRGTDRITTRMEQAERLDPVADGLAGVLDRVIPRGRVRDLLSGTAIGHPAHPALVLLPLGSWASAAVLDLFGGEDGRSGAKTLLAVGNLSAVPAVLAGVNDYLYTKDAARRVGLVHALANAGGLGLFTASWAVRRAGRHRLGATLSLAGLGLSGGAGWLGGHLTYARGVGVDTTVFQVLPHEWTDVAQPEQVPGDGQPIVVRVEGVPILLARHEGRLVAMANRCTHRGAPLNEGRVQDGCIICPWHESAFRLEDGQVIAGPATRSQPRLDVRVSAGRVEVRAAPEVYDSAATS